MLKISWATYEPRIIWYCREHRSGGPDAPSRTALANFDATLGALRSRPP